MSKKSDINLDQNNQKQTPHFLYDENQKLLLIGKYFTYFVGYVQGFPLSMVKGRYFKAVKNKPELNLFGLEERQYKEITERQMKQYNISVVLGGIVILILFILWYQYPLLLFYNLRLHPFLGWIIISWFFLIVTYLIFISILFRLLFRILEYSIPESFCIIQIINLNLELIRDDAIYRRDIKSMLLFRMDYLARVTMLIPWHYSIGRSSNQKWIQQHFQNISYYIRERRRWLIAPNETTLDDLRRDFRKLAYYYLTGKYGAWQWQSFELPTEVSKQTRFEKIQVTLIRFFGILLPLVIMGLVMLLPNNLPENIKSQVPYVFIGWLLVSMDVTLKLGVIESLTKLITGLKDLSK